MRQRSIFITIISLITILLISSFRAASTVAPEEASPACMLNLENMVLDDLEPEGADDLPVADKEMPLVTYQISGDTISNPKFESNIPAEFVKYQKDTADQARIWKFITDVIPSDRRTMLKQFIIFSDGYDNSTGAVDQADTSGGWTIEADAVDAQDFKMLSTTLIHEFGHMLTLNDQQITGNTETCDYYMTTDGCSLKDSYLNAFYNAFWTNIYGEWASDVQKSDGEVNEEAVANFYEKHKDQFLTDYAPTGPEEDIAESWTYFIFLNKPVDDSIPSQKIQFFYNYPELVQLRQQVLSGLCPYTEQ